MQRKQHKILDPLPSITLFFDDSQINSFLEYVELVQGQLFQKVDHKVTKRNAVNPQSTILANGKGIVLFHSLSQFLNTNPYSVAIIPDIRRVKTFLDENNLEITKKSETCFYLANKENISVQRFLSLVSKLLVSKYCLKIEIPKIESPSIRKVVMIQKIKNSYTYLSSLY